LLIAAIKDRMILVVARKNASFANLNSLNDVTG